jgi:hypothetical protein
MKYRDLAISEIRRLPELQPRASLNTERIEQYAEAYRRGDAMPYLVVFQVDGEFLLTQGFHRIAGAEAAGMPSVLCEVCPGTKAAATWDAATSNRDGDRATLHRSNADRVRAVELALRAKPKASNREIADAVWVDEKTVRNHRKPPAGSADNPHQADKTKQKAKRKEDNEPQVDDSDGPQEDEPSARGGGEQGRESDAPAASDSGFDFFWSKLQRLREVCAVEDCLFAAWLEKAAVMVLERQ